MKTVVMERSFVELEIKPQTLLAEYRSLVDADIRGRLAREDDLFDCACPACTATGRTFAFGKCGLAYQQCIACGSVYVAPRFGEAALADFYRNSEASTFWRQEILPDTYESRRQKVFGPRAQWLLDVVDEFRPDSTRALCIGYHNDILVEELYRLEEDLFDICVVNPIADIEFSEAIRKGLQIEPVSFHAMPSMGSFDLFFAFDAIDRSSDPDALFSQAYNVLQAGGLFLGTTNLISGFDLQVLWDRADSIYPPERMNLLSEKGLITLSERHGFEILEFSTPGVFDVEHVKRMMEMDPDGDWPRFTRYLLEHGSEGALGEFQEFLQRHRLSSFARIALRKP